MPISVQFAQTPLTLIAQYDSTRRCKVADFGLARLKSEDGYIPGLHADARALTRSLATRQALVGARRCTLRPKC